MVALTAVCNAPLLVDSPSLTKESRQCNIKAQICKSKKRFESWKKVPREALCGSVVEKGDVKRFMLD